MKRLILVLVLGMSTFLFAANTNKSVNLSVTLEDSIEVADTIAEAVRADTVYSGWTDIAGASLIQFYARTLFFPQYKSDLTTDTIFIEVLHSFDRVISRTWSIDTMLDTATNWDEFTISTTDSVMGGWCRLMVRHWDSTEADMPDSVDMVFKWDVNLWMNITR